MAKLNKIDFAYVVAFIMGLRPEAHLNVEELDSLISFPDPEPGKAEAKGVEALMAAMNGASVIDAIKSYRNITGQGLKESKDAVERHWKRSNLKDRMIEKINNQLHGEISNTLYILEGFSGADLIKVKNFIESF